MSEGQIFLSQLLFQSDVSGLEWTLTITETLVK